MISSRERRERKYEEMRDLLEDLSTQIEEIYNVPYKVDTARERDCLKC